MSLITSTITHTMPLRGAAQRAERFRQAQAELTPSQLQEQQRQNESQSQRLLAHTTLHSMKQAKRWFIEFLVDQHPEILNAETEYFTPRCGLPKTSLLREYARYLARSRVGQISEKLSIWTIMGYVSMLILSIRRSCNYTVLETDTLSRELLSFIRKDLQHQEGLSTKMHVQAVAHSEDLTFILSRLFQPRYLNTFPNMRVLVNLTLYILLVVDLCGRGGEIARNSVRPEHMCLHWGDVEFYAFARDGEDDTIDVRANVCIRWSKGETLDESKFRSIPFAGLLPVSMALEDTLRWLINLALLDGVFAQGIKTWDDLFNLKIPPGSRKTGIRIATNPAMRDIPVLRRMNAHRLTDKPVHTTEVQFEIHRLGLFCGFEHRLITYCFRRGVAYILALKTTDTTRRFLMGHKDDSAFRKYESKVSTVDFPALYRNMAPRSVLQQTSISLNRSDNAPVSISSSGKAAALEDDAVRAARSATEDLRKAIIVNHPSLIAASRAGDPLWTRYIRQQQRYRDTLVQVERRIFKAEYQLHFEERDLRQESGNCAAGKEQEEEQYDEEDADDRTSSLFIPEDDQMPTDSNDFLNDALELVSRFTWPTKHLAMPSEFRNREFRLLCSWFLTARTVT